MEIYCTECEIGHKRGCSHAEGRHYDVWGEGLSAPAYCPFEPGIPFGMDPDDAEGGEAVEVHAT